MKDICQCASVRRRKSVTGGIRELEEGKGGKRRMVTRDDAMGEASNGEEFDNDIEDEGGAELRVK